MVNNVCTFGEEHCGNPDVPNHAHIASSYCQREVNCPPGSAVYNGLCKSFKSEVCPLGNPMDCVTGEKTQVEVDLANSDFAPFGFTRYYSSVGFYEPRDSGPRSSTDPHYRQLGPNWRHTYQRAIKPEPVASGEPAMMTAMRPDGDYRHFKLVGGVWLGRKDKSENLQEIIQLGQRTGWRYQTADDLIEIYDADGRLQSISHPNGQILTLDYSTTATSSTIAPIAGLLISVVDSQGRELQLRYDNLARVSKIIDAAGVEHSYSYTTDHALTSVTRPGGAARTYLYNETAHNLNHITGKMLTGIVDENGQRYATYRYSHNKVNEEWHGSANADKLTITYTSGPTPPYYYARSTGALGNFEQRDLISVNGIVKEKSRKQCTTANCAAVISQTQHTYDSNGNIDQTVDARGTKTDYDFNTRGLETLKREGYVQPESCPATTTFDASNYSSSCTTGTCWKTSPFPGSSSAAPLGWGGWHYSCLQSTGPATHIRATETDWHATFNKPVERRLRNSSNVLEAKSQWAYNTRGQVVARCEIDVNDSAAMAYTCSDTTAPATGARVRRWTYAYCEAGDVAASNSTCPILGYIKSENGPRLTSDAGMNGLDDITSYAYYSNTDESGCGTLSGPCHRKGDLHTVTNALGHVTENVTYDKAGRVVRGKDPNGTLTDAAYNTRGWMTSRTIRALASGANNADDATTAFAYDSSGQVTRVTQPDGAYLNYTYDDAHRLTDIVDNLSNRIHYTLDAAGNRVKEETFDSSYNPATPGMGLKRVMSRQFNALGRLVRELNAANAATRDSTPYDSGGLSDGFDAAGNNVQFKNGLNVQTQQSYDALNRLVKSVQDYTGTDPETGNATIEFVYDASDNLRTVKDPSNLTTSYTYDGLRDLTDLDSPDTGHTEYGYDLAANRISQTDSRGVTTTSTFDALDRSTGISFPNSALNIVFNYDQYDSTTTCPGSQSKGKLTSVIEASGSTTYCYDHRGNVTKKNQTIASKTITIEYAYNKSDQITDIRYPDGGIATYGRDNMGRTSSVSWRSSETGLATTVVADITYYPYGPMYTTTFGSGRSLTKAYDQNYLIEAVTSSGNDGLVLDFATDAVGNVVSVADAIGQSSPDLNYIYDNHNRLTQVNDESGILVENYNYNKSGDRTLKKVPGKPTATYLYGAGSHRISEISGIARTHDARGNTTSTGNRTLEYDDSNRLSRVIASSTKSYKYSAMGERALANTEGDPDKTIYFMYDEEGRLLGKQTEASDLLIDDKYLYVGETPVARIHGSAIDYIETDHLGTPRLAVSADTGARQWWWSPFLSAFGENDPVVSPGARPIDLRYAGQQLDEETGFTYNYFRDYESDTGRYLQSDPIGLSAGINTYAYVESQPLTHIDPRGLSGSKPGGPYHPPNGVKTKCRPTDSCPVLLAKMYILGRMIESHTKWDWIMPSPRGGGRHTPEIADLWKQFGECVGLATVKCAEMCKKFRFPFTTPPPIIFINPGYCLHPADPACAMNPNHNPPLA